VSRGIIVFCQKNKNGGTWLKSFNGHQQDNGARLHGREVNHVHEQVYAPCGHSLLLHNKKAPFEGAEILHSI